MVYPTKTFRVGLILSSNLPIEDYETSIGNQNYLVSFYSNAGNDSTKYCDLVITDLDPDEFDSTPNQIPNQLKDTHGTTLILNKFSNPILENQYENYYSKAGSIKYRSNEKISENFIKKLINSELIKTKVKDNNLNHIFFILNRNTRTELIKQIFTLSWLLIPFILIVFYLFLKLLLLPNLSFLCWFAVYEPGCDKNILEELKLLALIYSVFNLIFYYNYILTVFSNINNDIYQTSRFKEKFNSFFQSFTPVVLFVSAVIILKAIFVFRYTQSIAAANEGLRIATIFDKWIPYIRDEHLIYYFLATDVCLWLISNNFLKTIPTISLILSSNRQIRSIEKAKKSFTLSIIWNIIIIIFTIAIFNFLVIDPQSKLAIQLILLQGIYLYLNLSTIIYDFKYE